MTTTTTMARAASLSPTSEVLWDGRSKLPFVLKRKRNGAILVTQLRQLQLQQQQQQQQQLPDDHAEPTHEVPLRLGSELKLVGGFPVQQLTLSEVKKVMLRAPKPVSLVFIHHDLAETALDNMSFLSSDGSELGDDDREVDVDVDAHLTSAAKKAAMFPIPRESGEWEDVAEITATSRTRSTGQGGEQSSASPASSASTSSGQRRRRRRSRESARDTRGSLLAPPRKISKLKLALERMNELLNRPVRRSALNVPAGKSIVV